VDYSYSKHCFPHCVLLYNISIFSIALKVCDVLLLLTKIRVTLFSLEERVLGLRVFTEPSQYYM
jgi:hypothetical protein